MYLYVICYIHQYIYKGLDRIEVNVRFSALKKNANIAIKSRFLYL